MAFLYIIHSHTINKYYVGITQDSVEKRLIKHNQSSYGKHYTTQANDWNVVLTVPFENFSLAQKAERYIKKMKSRRFIEKLIFNENERATFVTKVANI